MSVSQGLTALANNNPSFSNQHIQNNIASVVLTNSQKTDVYDAMESQSYLNIGRYFLDLDNHTYKILDGSLGETNANDTTTATFLEHLSLVDGIQGVYQSLYGTDADAAGKGIDDFFGSLRGTLISSVEALEGSPKTLYNCLGSEEGSICLLCE